MLRVFALVLWFGVPLMAVPPLNLEYAKNFKIEYKEGYSELTILEPYKGSKETRSLILVQRGEPLPQAFKEEEVLRVPVKRTIALTTVVLAHLDILGVSSSCVAVDQHKYVNTQSIVENIKQEKVQEVGSGRQLNRERLLLLKPDLVFAFTTGPNQWDSLEILDRAKIKTGLMASYMEAHLLARAEWIKYTACFFGKEREATVHFEKVKKAYYRYKALAHQVKNKPKVFCNAPFSGVWHMPGGDSWVARAIEDAGGDYLWSDDQERGSLKLSFEQVLSRALTADIWLNPLHSSEKTLKALENKDARFKHFKSFKEAQVWVNNKRLNKYGGNDIFESGLANPHWVLRDLIQIFHPNLIGSEEMMYHQRLGP